MESTIKVALYEDNAALRCSLFKLFGTCPRFEFLGAYADAGLIVENTRYRKPDVILMDIDMPGISGIEAVALVRSAFPEIKVLMLTVFDDNDNVFQSICNGAIGYLLKESDPMEILDAVKEVYEGGAPMTPVIAIKVLQLIRNPILPKTQEIDLSDREREILTMLTRGMSYKMIAAECGICIDTVRFHIKNIYEKLQVHSMTEAVSKALKNKWV